MRKPSTTRKVDSAAANGKTKRKHGRPTKYTPALGDEICIRLVNGESLRDICRDDHMPDESSVRYWAIDQYHPFSPQYTLARQTQAIAIAEEILSIADDTSNDFVETQDGRVLNSENIARSRLRVDTRKWILAKMLPKIYGDKVQTELTGQDGGPIKTEVVFSIVDGHDPRPK